MKYTFFCFMCIAPFFSYGQKDSTRTLKTSLYPEIRPVQIQYEQGGSRDFSYKYQGKTFSGKVEEYSRLSTLVTAPLIMRKKFILAASVNYFRQHTEYSKSNNLVSDRPDFYKHDEVVNETLSLSLGSVLKDSLFGKPVTFIGNIYLDSRNLTEVDRIRAVTIATIGLKRTEVTKVSVGIGLMFNSTSSLPICPIVRYWHKFKNSDWLVDAVLPKSVYFRKHSINSSWLSIGVEGVKNSFISQVGSAASQGEYFNSMTEIRGGLSYEYPLHPWIMFGVKAGASRLLNARINDNNGSSEMIMRGSGGTSPYLNLNISLTPSLSFKK